MATSTQVGLPVPVALDDPHPPAHVEPSGPDHLALAVDGRRGGV